MLMPLPTKGGMSCDASPIDRCSDCLNSPIQTLKWHRSLRLVGFGHRVRSSSRPFSVRP